MSGYKHATVTISREEYQRLHEADMKKKFKEFTKTQSQDSSRDEVVLNLIQQLEERERYLQSVLGSMNQTTSMIDQEILDSVHAQNANNYQLMMQTLRSAAIDFDDSLDTLSRAFAAELQVERENNYQNLQAILQTQEAVLDREYAKEEAAQSWLNRSALLVDFIQSQFDHERFAPGRLNKIIRNLTLAENNLAQGFYESSLQQSQQMYIELSDLNLELEQVLLQWQTLFAITYAEVREMVEQLSSNSEICALGLQGEELPNLVNLDFWTNSRFHQLLEHCRQLSNYLYQDQNVLSFEDIERVHAQILPAIQEAFETIIFDARLNALNSQLRMNIAEKALQALETHGFVLDGAGYTNNDMRSQFNARLECPDGSHVLIQVVPTDKSKEELSNELVVITTHPYLKSDHEARLRWEELSHSLKQYNLRVSPPEVLESPATPMIEAVENNQPSEQLFTRTER